MSTEKLVDMHSAPTKTIYNFTFFNFAMNKNTLYSSINVQCKYWCSDKFLKKNQSQAPTILLAIPLRQQRWHRRYIEARSSEEKTQSNY
jgi:hypothetical protein